MVCVDNERADPKSERRQLQQDKEGDYYAPFTKSSGVIYFLPPQPLLRGHFFCTKFRIL
jgi:hypothetical protein